MEVQIAGQGVRHLFGAHANNPESLPRLRRDASTKLSTGNMRRKSYSIVLLF